MICKKYDELSHVEKVTFVGGLIHAVQSDDDLFQIAQEIKRLAILKGLFDNVIINPPSEPTHTHPQGGTGRNEQY